MPKPNDKVTISRSQNGPGDLCGAKEAATILQVERTRIARYQREDKMPRKVAHLSAGPVYLRKDVEKMAEGRLKNGAKPVVEGGG